MVGSFKARTSALLENIPHQNRPALLEILTSRTSISTTGFPYIANYSFRLFLREVPHLFQDGETLLRWVEEVETKLEDANTFSKPEKKSLRRALKVIRNMVYSAGICAPPDLWILRHVLSTHAATGLIDYFESGETATVDSLATRFGLNPKHLQWDLSLLCARGYLSHRNGTYRLADNVQAQTIYREISPLPKEFLRDMVESLVEVLLRRKTASYAYVSRFLQLPRCSPEKQGWFASHMELETGYRLVPLLLALHLEKAGKQLEKGLCLVDVFPGLTTEMTALLQQAGIVNPACRITNLGARMFSRGPGPFGIIHAYVPYMAVLREKLEGKAENIWVQRGKNIAASQDANRKTFLMANDSLDRFCVDYGFQYRVFIEHALGLGEATRQRLERSGEETIQYFGADLEDAAIDRAIAAQKEGKLPQNMIFIRKADIGNPLALISEIRASGFRTEGSVMIVGNGFHEIRGQTNEKVVEIFRGYSNAGMILIFTEESALNDNDLLATGWNTYHSGFRYVHELSGQGLRPAAGTYQSGRHSWKICASLSGYAVLPKYSSHTRTIYPYPRKGGYNPPISMTYFCVPFPLATELGFYPISWTAVH